MKWKQIGIKELIADETLPFFIEWLSTDHPSADGTPRSEIQSLEIAGEEAPVLAFVGRDLAEATGDIDVKFVPVSEENGVGLISVTFKNHNGEVKIS